MKTFTKIAVLLGLSFYGLSFLQADDAPPYNSVSLGKELFFDKILSEDQTISCASCHRPEYAFSDTSAVSVGVHGRLGGRNTPSAMNVSGRSVLFWDGRAATLEEQALGPIANPVEMNLAVDSAVARLQASPLYRRAFQEAFEAEPSKELLALALADFQRSLETGSRYDDFMSGNDKAISESAKRGLELFNVKGKCFDCHFGPDMTGDEFRSIGTFDGKVRLDKGRFDQTKDSTDMGKFKTPGLRNIAVTGPYFHDGSFKTLAEVIEYYNKPAEMIPHGLNRDTLLAQPLGLTAQEMLDLEAFLISLTAPQFEHLLTEEQRRMAFSE